MDLAVTNRLTIFITDCKPLINLLTTQEVLDRQVSPPNHIGPNRVVDLDGENDIRGEVGAVDVERLVPARIVGVVGDQTSTPDTGFLQINGGIYPGGTFADTHGILDPLHKLIN
jgi:hypothetical protein